MFRSREARWTLLRVTAFALSALTLSTLVPYVYTNDRVAHAIPRYMVVLREGIDPEDLLAVGADLRNQPGLRVVATFSQGALIGIVVESDAFNPSEIRKWSTVERVQQLAIPGSAPPGEVGNKFFRTSPGWAIPGVYEVMLRGHEATTNPRSEASPVGIGPDRKANGDASVAAVRMQTNQLVAAHGARLLSVFAPSSMGFSCAMNEQQAMKMATDPRVESVAESVYTLME